MLLNGPQKLLFILDLKYIHFNPQSRKLRWLGAKRKWVEFYNNIIKLGQKADVDIIFAVVAKHKHFDDIASQAAKSFQRFLAVGLPNMYQNEQQKQWCLVNFKGQLRYQSLNTSHSKSCDQKGAISHFVIVPDGNSKSPYILEIAKYHNILPENCLVLDYCRTVLEEVTAQGMASVSFEAFSLSYDDSPPLSNQGFVNSILRVKQNEITDKVKEMIYKGSYLYAFKNWISLSPQLMENKLCDLPVFENRTLFDPTDALYSWQSFRLFSNEAVAEEAGLSITSLPEYELPTTYQKNCF
jgi:hypothetical protein